MLESSSISATRKNRDAIVRLEEGSFSMRDKLGLKLFVLLLTIFGFVAAGEARKIHVAVPDLSMSLIAFIVSKEEV